MVGNAPHSHVAANTLNTATHETGFEIGPAQGARRSFGKKKRLNPLGTTHFTYWEFYKNRSNDAQLYQFLFFTKFKIFDRAKSIF